MRTKNIASNIRSVRKALGLTLREFVKPLDVSQGYLSDIENGKKVPSSTLERLLIVHYEINPQWWESGEGEMFIKGVGKAEGHIEPELARAIAKKLQAEYEGKAIELTGEELMAVQMLRDLSDHDRQRIMHTLQMAWTAGKVDKG